MKKTILSENYKRFFKEDLLEGQTASTAEKKQYESDADDAKAAGASVTIDEKKPTVNIKLASGGTRLITGNEARRMLGRVPDNVDAEVFILSLTKNW